MAAGLLALAASWLPALADDSPIRFASGPFAGAVAEDAKHEVKTLSEAGGGSSVADTAVFRANGLVAFVGWSRLTGRYIWRDGDYHVGLSRSLQRIFNATGVTVLQSDRITVNGYLAQYRLVGLTGVDRRCGVFVLKRQKHLIQGFTCGSTNQDVQLQAVMEGLSIDGVIGP